MGFELVSITLKEARCFINEFHRHNKPPHGWKFGVGIRKQDELIGVAVAGRCISRVLDSKETIEITRVCTFEEKNANSFLYGAILRASKELGFKIAYTYTLESESGSSLLATGFKIDGFVKAGKTWDCNTRPRIQIDLFGNHTRPIDSKIRWKKYLTRKSNDN